MPSAWRGEATNWMPKRPMSKTTLPVTLSSASQPLQPPAETWRSLSERPKSCASFGRARAPGASGRRTAQVAARACRETVVVVKTMRLQGRPRHRRRRRGTPRDRAVAAIGLDRAGRADVDAGDDTPDSERVHDRPPAESWRERSGLREKRWSGSPGAVAPRDRRLRGRAPRTTG